MAQQKGHLPVKGRIGNLSFYKTRDGFLVKEKGGIDKNRITSLTLSGKLSFCT